METIDQTKICAECNHVMISPYAGNLLCNAPQLGEYVGQSCKMMRERGNQFQKNSYAIMFKKIGICGGSGQWYESSGKNILFGGK